MNEERMIDPGHDDVRKVLRVVGPAVAGVGLVFLVVGMVSFFSAFGTFEPPRLFWCMFVGIPLLGVGLGITKFAFLGSIFRYVMGETAPVAKDTFNEMARGTAPAARDFARDVSRGIAEGLATPGRDERAAFCPKCGAGASPDDRYCSKCGAPLAGPGEAREL